MIELQIQRDEETGSETCSICGRHTISAAGMQLVQANTDKPVCPDCGRKHDPSLAALVNLADAATRIGRIGRHSVFPPLTALLDLASAAEKYAQTTAPAPS
jgi:hypothetical protein